jgi:hypothetical protein
VRPFPAHDHPHPSRPAGQGEQSGQLGDVGAVAYPTVGVDRRQPGRRRQGGDGGAFGLADRPADRVLHPSTPTAALRGEPVDDRVGGGGRVAAHQQMPAMLGRDLRKRLAQHVEVVGGGVRPGVAGPQLDREQLVGVVAGDQDDESAWGAVPVLPLVRFPRPLASRRTGWNP